ncbi:MAG: hypothetical protein M3141_05115 [Actinomycetota bacterium]|nr:hypothetical protein [Actinomycetota bacterium]
MAGPALRGECEAFAVTVEVPNRGDRELAIEVIFAPGGPTDSATIELRLYARRIGAILRGEHKWDTEGSVPGTKARLERGATGRLRFTRPLPPFVASYRGTGLEVAAVLVTEGHDKSNVRLLLDPVQVAQDAVMVVRTETEPLRATGVLGPLRGKVGVAHFRNAGPGAVGVTARGQRAFTGGRVRLEALEYERYEGKRSDWEPPIVATEATLFSTGAGGLRGELALPEATAAPASIECGWASRTQGIRWVARFELEDSDGDVIRAQAPLHVGVERPAAT